MKVIYLLYDSRAMGDQGTDDAMVLCCANTDREAKEDARMFGYDLAIYKYDVKGNELINERWHDDFYAKDGFVSQMDLGG